MSNRLSVETSPYLRQHAENPVDWYPWGEEAFRRAREEDKPVHLSVGYAACHWCHVMAHESFENPAIARLMNEHFINIKVDRQERPDLDDIYQKVVQLKGQGGGWPLTVFVTPQGEPFFGGTYFPPEERYGRPGFSQVLLSLSEAWKERRPELRTQVEQFLKGYRILDERLIGGEAPTGGDVPAEAARDFAANTDPVHGGFGDAPKFPNPSCHDLVLRVYHRTREPQLLAAVERTLDHMAAGGIVDHLGGGFARYRVDARWAVPHFEKMLYDNGQLVKLYADAYRVTGKRSWRRVFEQTIAYVLRDLAHPDGGFYASEDADSEGEEGTFYVWTPAQIEAVLGPTDAAFVCRAYGVTEQGNFEHGTTVLYRAVELDALEEARLEGLREPLFAARALRVRPGRDENILTSWNALMIQGLCAAYQATGQVLYLQSARRAADFLLQRMSMPDGGLYRAWKDGAAKVPGFLDDYAFLANALIDLYESGFDKRDLDRAESLVDLILDKFWDDGFYFTSKDGERLVHRSRSPQDHAWPSGTATSVFALLRLHELTGRDKYRERAEQVFQMYGAAAAQNPFGFSHLLAALDFSQRPVSIVLAGDRGEASALVEAVHRSYHCARSGVCRGCSDRPGSAPGRRPACGLRVPKPNLLRASDERAGALGVLHSMSKITMTSHRPSVLSGEPGALERADLLEGDSSPENVVVAYHERTKHHFHRYAAAQGTMDWATQPDPFRRYAGANLVRLPLPKTGRPLPYWQLYASATMPPAALSFESVSLFFRYALSLTVWKQVDETRWPLRANPSSGNLHPTEGYALLPALDQTEVTWLKAIWGMGKGSTGDMRMTDEHNEQKASLTWEVSAAVLQTDAKQGIARAQRLLAMRYLRGRGVHKDEAIAFYWMQLAAQQHFSLAQRSLGELYENGLGITLDITQASHWYRLAALQGDSIAQEHWQRLAQPKRHDEKGNQSTQQGKPA